ncbi:MAG: bifunctional DNA primase/polymerase [Burkholderiales bacterium]|jgi:putative DNA primase/helicase|nr:bifunctional DNA primase/polymerase [Burkholderiales bacterium]
MDSISSAPEQEARAGAKPDDWAAWQGFGLTSELLPIVSNIKAEISAGSKLVEESLGKVPTAFDSQGKVHGFKQWTQRCSTSHEVARWSADPRLGICVQCRVVKAFDIDIADPAAAQAVHDLLEIGLGALPVRGRANSGKRLLAFRLAADFPKRILKTAHGNIELLSTGQQFVACGTHKSGARYEWAGGLPAELPTLSMEEVDAAWQALAHAFALPGGAAEARAPLVIAAAWRAEDCDDPDVPKLFELGLVVDAEDNTGKLHVLCPWASEHTNAGDPTATTYMPRGLRGQDHAGFRCLHAHCEGRTIFDFRRAAGFDDVAAEFDVVDLDEPVEPPSPQHSDDQLALAFAGKVHPGLRYTPGMGWLAHGEHHWRRDDNLHRMTLARALCRDAAKQAERPNERKALASARTINAVVSLAQSDQRLLVPADAWDADAFALNTPAGLVNLRTGTIRPRLGDLVARVTRVSPDFAAAHPTWSGFLDSVCGGDAELVGFLQRMAGYLLTGDRREQKLFFIWGKGSNGKSTFGELLLWILGGYGLKLSSSVLMQSPHDRHPTELAQLQGARAAVSSELEEGQFFNESRVKELTGDDTLSARFMRGDFFEFAMTHKHLVIGNHKPRLKGGDPAMARRLVLVPFRAAFNGSAADPEMPAKLRAEAPAILAWMVRGAVDWAAGGLGIPPVVRAASEEYMADHNDVEQWLGDSCDMAHAEKEKASTLYDSFARWKLARGERAPSAVTWAERMALISGLQRVRSNGSWWVGVRLRTGADADEFA